MPAPPPPGPPWDTPVDEASLAFVDLEMTGLDPKKDRVIEICVQRTRGLSLESELNTLVRPSCGRFGNQEIHGISAADLVGAPTFEEVSPEVERIFAGAVAVAHGASWDLRFLRAEYRRLGQRCPIEHVIDTLSLSRRALALPSHRLGTLCEELGVEAAPSHRARADVLALRGVFAQLVPRLGASTPRDLWHVRVGERQPRPDIIAALVEAQGRGKSTPISYRPSGKAVEQLDFVVTEVRQQLDPPVVLGYLLPSRARRVLRADRVLSVGATPDAPA